METIHNKTEQLCEFVLRHILTAFFSKRICMRTDHSTGVFLAFINDVEWEVYLKYHALSLIKRLAIILASLGLSHHNTHHIRPNICPDQPSSLLPCLFLAW